MNHHVFITGTGRAGTTFLMQLLTELGQDTGYKTSSEDIVAGEQNCGMERYLYLQEGAPYFIKSPYLIDKIPIAISRGWTIDYLIVPMRKLSASAESRRRVAELTGDIDSAGGLHGVRIPEHQENHLSKMTHTLFYYAAKYSIPVILLHFPRLVSDADYLYDVLKPILNSISFEGFVVAFKKISRPDLVHIPE